MAVKLTVVAPGTSAAEFAYTFDQEKIVIGRGAGVDVRLPSPAVSEKHCVIRLEGQDYILFDPGSTNGTFHNGQHLVEGRRKLLRSGDTIVVAGFTISFRAGLAMQGAHNAERTAALARRMVREALGAVGPGSEPPRLTFLNGRRAGERFAIPESEKGLTVGRDLTCEVHVDDSDASRRHALLRRTWEGVMISDLGAKNVTLVNDVPIAAERRLKDRDEILIGATRLVYEDPAEAFLRELDLLERDAAMATPARATAKEETGAADSQSTGDSRRVSLAGASGGGVSDGAALSDADSDGGSAVIVKRGDEVGSWTDVRRELDAPDPEAPVGVPDIERTLPTDPIRTMEPAGSRLADVFVVLLGIAILVGAVAALVIVLD